MCGFAGFLDPRHTVSREVLEATSSDMAAELVHRGPDDAGSWADAEAGVALAHRRLSIIDLSAAGHQPMISSDGRYVMVYNGELYNFEDVRKQLEREGLATGWRGHSDTEVLLAAISAWGLTTSLQRFIGMFSFALWDRKERELILARDRLGEKPLYYGNFGGCLIFASELKAFRKHPAWNGTIDRDSLALMVRFSCLPHHHSIFKGVNKVLPGMVARFSAPGSRPVGAPETEFFWNLESIAYGGAQEPFMGGDSEAVTQLDRLIRNSVRRQMVSDVPFGAFLSGGIDSSMIVAAMQAESSRPVKTFTIGFNESSYDEAANAREISRHFGTEHTELYVTPREAMAVIPKLPRIYDEPFADSSQIPTFLVSQLAHEQVTVSLSGDGGDELFAGYNRHVWGKNILAHSSRVPSPIVRAGGRLLAAVPTRAWDRVYGIAEPLLPAKLRMRIPGEKLHKLSRLLAAENRENFYLDLVSDWDNPAELVIGSHGLQGPGLQAPSLLDRQDFTLQMLYLDTVTYLPDDILVKVDRAAMAVSLESRLPFLDHELVAFAWSLPLSMKIRGGIGKWVLRQALSRYVPPKLFERPKMGFGIPIDSWLRGPLRGWAEELISVKRLNDEGYFNPAPIRKKWDEHMSGAKNWQHHLWDILMFQSWLEANR
ncbi:MAG: asparagine synthase (glutamine-hydrolyzing) [Thermoleophilia bacterium]|nr:asparagine synthase (glutamine-hydrolyzing) [Thermoleophilia bacterium]